MKLFILERPNNIDSMKQLYQLIIANNGQESLSIMNYRKIEDCLNSMLGNLLIQFVLKTHYHCSDPLWRNNKGKLYVNSTSWKGDVSLSHSHSMIACAVNPNAQVGVDIEKIGDIDFALCNEFLSNRELNFLKSQSAEERLSVFYKFWTLKEAYLKAIGEGVRNMDLAMLEFDLTASPQPVLLEKENNWNFFTEKIMPLYQLSLCYQANQHKNIKIIYVSINELMTYLSGKNDFAKIECKSVLT
jgi:4'-phosphopantetheinyl transferase